MCSTEGIIKSPGLSAPRRPRRGVSQAAGVGPDICGHAAPAAGRDEGLAVNVDHVDLQARARGRRRPAQRAS